MSLPVFSQLYSFPSAHHVDFANHGFQTCNLQQVTMNSGGPLDQFVGQALLDALDSQSSSNADPNSDLANSTEAGKPPTADRHSKVVPPWRLRQVQKGLTHGQWTLDDGMASKPAHVKVAPARVQKSDGWQSTMQKKSYGAINLQSTLPKYPTPQKHPAALAARPPVIELQSWKLPPAANYNPPQPTYANSLPSTRWAAPLPPGVPTPANHGFVFPGPWNMWQSTYQAPYKYSPQPTTSRYNLRSDASLPPLQPMLAVEPTADRPKLQPQDLNALGGKQAKTSRGAPALPKPVPTAEYLKQASAEPINLENPRRLLLVIDLNGTLLFRTNSKSSFTPRANLYPFLKHLLDNHNVMIWSSSTPHNVQTMVSRLFDDDQNAKLVAVWARDTLRLSGIQYRNKVQVYKQLDWIWKDKHISELPFWAICGLGQHNTVLLDDSIKKAAAEPHNLLELPEFFGKVETEDVLGQVLGYLDWLRYQNDVSCAMRKKPFKVSDGWRWKWT